jgi:serine/threonine protein kinase
MGSEAPENRVDPERADGGSGADGPPGDRFATLPETEARPASPEGGDLAGNGLSLANRSDDLDAIPVDADGYLFGKYRVVRKLGDGGMGSVWLVEHVGLEQHRALKIIKSDLADSPTGLDRFRREAKILARLSRHPNAVTVYDAGLVDRVAYIEMDYIEGPTLRQRLGQTVRMPVHDVLWVLGEVCAVLGEAHRLGIVHRDIKPQNVMIVPDPAVPRDERVKVLDFGIAKLIRDATADTGSSPYAGAEAGRQAVDAPATLHTDGYLGTINYSSPEQLGLLQAGQTRAEVDHRSDIYSLGVLLYEMLAGTRPFSGAQTRIAYDHAHTPPPRFAEAAPGVYVPAAVEAVVRRCLQKDAADRPQSMDDLLRLFQAATETHAMTEGGSVPSIDLGLADPSDDDAVPTDGDGNLFGKYRVLRKLGDGGMGSVYLAEHIRLRQQRALKIIKAEVAESETNRVRFQQEAIILARLSRHPNAIVVYDAGFVGKFIYIDMELQKGQTLRNRLQSGGPMPPRDVLWVLEGVCALLSEAHRLGIVHGEIKPQKIMLVPDPATARGETVKVLDLGIPGRIPDAASEATALSTQDDIGVMRAIPYASPEQLGLLQAGETQGVVDHRSDIYSLGVMLYEMLAGIRPFIVQQTKILGDHAHIPPPPFAEVAPDVHVPAAVAAVVRRCLMKHPADRPQSADELFRRFEAAVGKPDAPGDNPDLGNKPRPAARRRIRRRAAAGVLAACLVVGACGWFLWPRIPSPMPSAHPPSVGSLPQKAVGVEPRADSGIPDRAARVSGPELADGDSRPPGDVPPGAVKEPVTIMIGADRAAWRRKYPGVDLSRIKDQFEIHPNQGFTHLGKPLDCVVTVRNQLPKELKARCLVELTDPHHSGATWGHMKLFEHVLSLGRRGSSTDAWTFPQSVSFRYNPDDTRVLKVTLEAVNPAAPAGNRGVEPWKKELEVTFSQVGVSSYMDVKDRFDPDCSNPQHEPHQRCYIVTYKRRGDDPFTEPIGADEWRCKIRDRPAMGAPDWVWPGMAIGYHYYPADPGTEKISWSGQIENERIEGEIGRWRPK